MASKRNYVIDANLWLSACGRSPHDTNPIDPKTKSPDSRLDVNLRQQNLDPAKIRGTLCLLLEKGEIILPRKVHEELSRQQKNPSLGEHNRKMLAGLTTILENGLEPARDSSQNLAFALRHAPTQGAALRKIREIANQQPHGKTPLHRFWSKVLDANQNELSETNQTKIDNPRSHEVAQELQNTAELYEKFGGEDTFKKLTTLQTEARRLTPKLIPDFEIIAEALEVEGCAFSMDRDFLVWKSLPSLQPHVFHLNAEWIGTNLRKSLDELKTCIKQKIRQKEQEPI